MRCSHCGEPSLHNFCPSCARELRMMSREGRREARAERKRDLPPPTSSISVSAIEAAAGVSGYIGSDGVVYLDRMTARPADALHTHTMQAPFPVPQKEEISLSDADLAMMILCEFAGLGLDGVDIYLDDNNAWLGIWVIFETKSDLISLRPRGAQKDISIIIWKGSLGEGSLFRDIVLMTAQMTKQGGLLEGFTSATGESYPTKPERPK